MRSRLLLAPCLVAALFASGPAWAATFTAGCAACDFTDVVDAVKRVPAGSVIDVEPGAYKVGTLVLDRDLTMQALRGSVSLVPLDDVLLDVGSKSGAVTVSLTGSFVLDGDQPRQARLGWVHDGATLSLTDVTLINSDVHGGSGTGDGAGMGVAVQGATLTALRTTFSRLSGDGRKGGAVSGWSSASVTLKDCTLDHNDAQSGGAVAVWGGSSLTLSGGTVLSDNDAAFGGAIYVHSSTLIASDSTLEDNSAKIAGGAALLESATATLTSVRLHDNGAPAGGAIAANGPGTLNVTDGVLSGNSAATRGGALLLTKGVTTTLTETTLSDGVADVGGAVAAEDSDVTLSSVTMRDNVATQGGHLFVEGKAGTPTVLFTHALFKPRNVVSGGGLLEGEKATAAHRGGGIYAVSADLKLYYTDVSELTSWAGAGVFAEASKLGIHSSTFTENEAEGDAVTGVGGAISAVSSIGTVKVWSSGFLENRAGGDGGAVHTVGGGALDVRSSTFNRNDAERFGGAIQVEDHLLAAQIKDSVFSDNTAADGGGALGALRAPVRILGDGASAKFIDNAVTGARVVARHGLPGRALLGRGGGAVWLRDDRAFPAGSTIDGVVFTRNETPDHGGSLWVDRLKSISVQNSTFLSNESGVHGGAAYVHSVPTLLVSDVVFTSNGADGDGGALVLNMVDKATFTTLDLKDNASGLAGGGGFARNLAVGSLVLDGDQTWHDNDTVGSGGAWSVQGLASVTIDPDTLDASRNHAGYRGGAVYVDNVAGAVSIDGGAWSENDARYGAALAVNGLSEVVVTGSTLQYNEAGDAGGAIFGVGVASIELVGTTVHNNRAAQGGGVHVTSTPVLAFEAAIIEGNIASVDGGGVRLVDSGVWADEATVMQVNEAGAGGGALRADGGSGVHLTGTAVLANRAAQGGGIAVFDADLTLLGAAVRKNLGSVSAGGVLVDGAANVLVRGTLFEENRAPVAGGLQGVRVDDLQVRGATFVGNVADHDALAIGGGMHMADVSSLAVEQTHFRADHANEGGAALYAVGTDEVRFVRNVVCGVTSEAGRAVRIAGGDGDGLIANNVMDGRGSALGRLLGVQDRRANIVHNHILGSQDTAVSALGWTGALNNNLFMDHVAAEALIVDDSTPALALSHSAFYATGAAVGGRFVADLPAAVLDDPRLVAWPVPVDDPCSLSRYYPRADSPLLGAGDATWPDLSGDGTPRADGYSTIGAFGGPHADPDLFVDVDEDGVVGLLDCDDNDPALSDGAYLWPDADADGLGDRAMPPSYECAGKAGWVDNSDDCDDADTLVGVGESLWPDLDLDGLGDRYTTAGYACIRPGWVDNDLDCDDTATYVGEAYRVWPDSDGDGFGDRTADALALCEPSELVARNNLDCDDSDPSVVSDCGIRWYGSGCSTAGSDVHWVFLFPVVFLVRRQRGRRAG